MADFPFNPLFDAPDQARQESQAAAAPPPRFAFNPLFDDPTGARVSQDARDGKSWSDVADTLGDRPDKGQLEQQFRLDKRRAYESQRAETAQEFVATRALPFASAIGNTAREIRYKRVMEQVAAGKAPSDDDIEFAARHEHLQQFKAERQKTLLGSLAEAGAGIPALLGEAMTVRAGSTALLGAERAAGLGLGGRAALSAAEAPAMPSLYAEQAAERATQQGGEVTDLKNLAPPLAMAALQNVVLGRLQGAAAKSTVPTAAGRAAYAGALGVGEQAGVDVAAGLADEFLPERFQTKTRYGTLGDLARGEPDKAATHATVQALTFSAFAGMHGREADPAKTLAPALDSLAPKGGSKEVNFQKITDAVEGKIEPPTPEVKTHVEAMDAAAGLTAEPGVDPKPGRAALFAKLRAAGAKTDTSDPTLSDVIQGAGLEGRQSELSKGDYHRTLNYPAPEGGDPLAMHFQWFPDKNAIDLSFTFKEKFGGIKEAQKQLPKATAVELLRDLTKIAGAAKQKGIAIEFRAEDKRAAIYDRGLTKAGYEKVSEQAGGEDAPGFKDYRYEPARAEPDQPNAPAEHEPNAVPPDQQEVAADRSTVRQADVEQSPSEPVQPPPEIAPGSPQRAPEPGVASGPSEVPIAPQNAPQREGRAPKELSERERAVLDGLAVHGEHGGGQRVADELGISRERVRQIKNDALGKLGKTLEEYKADAAEKKRNNALDRIERQEHVDPSELHNVPREGAKLVSGREKKITSDIEVENRHGKKIDALIKELTSGKNLDDARRAEIFAEVEKLQRLEEERSRPPRRQPPGVQAEAPEPEPAAPAPAAAAKPAPGGRARSDANLKQNAAPRRAITQFRRDGGIDPEKFIAVFGRGEFDAVMEGVKAKTIPNPFQDAQGRRGTRHPEDIIAELARVGDLRTETTADGRSPFPDTNDFLDLLRTNRPLGSAVESAAGQRQIESALAAHERRQQAEAEARGEKIAPPSDEPIPFFRLPWQKKPTPPNNPGGPAPASPPSPPGPSGVADEVRTLLAPATRSEPAKLGAGVVRANNAILAHKKAIAEAALKSGERYFDDLVTKAAGDEAKLKDLFLAFTDPIQKGTIAQMGPEMKGIAETVRKLYDERTAAVTSRKLIDGSKLIENYVTQLWADPKRPDATPEEIGRQLGGRRPLAGAEGFKKERFYDTYRDGIEAGLVPRDWNPVRTLLAGLHQIDKSVMAHDTVQELKENGLWEFVRLGGERKPGWEHINDKIATVFAPPEAKVKEYFDKQQMEGLEKFAESLGLDVQTARDSADVVRRGVAGGLPPPVGKKGGTLGASVGDSVIRRFGTPEEVLAHEIGHQLDRKYDLARGLQAPGLAPEMEALAKLRASGRVSPEYAAYLQQPNERAANLVAAYLHAPELLRKVAPLSAEWFDALVASHPELHPIRDIKPSLELGERDQMMRLAGPMLTGHFTTPGEVATLLNNHLSPSLHGQSVIYAGVRHVANMINGFQLGFSLFHAGVVTADAQVSALALGFKQISRGDFLAGLKQGASAFVPGLPPVRAFLAGTKVGKEYFAPGSQGAEIAGLVEMLEQAGGRAKMDAFHGGDRVEAFRKAIRAVQLGDLGKLPHALLNALPAVSEAIQKPVMEVLVPRMKTGIFADMARYELEKNPNMTREEFRDVLGKGWDSVENRLGQMTYDNLFWNRTFKDLLMIGVRSVGWNVGTVRELAGGVRDIPRAVRDVPAGRGVSDRLAYAAALPIVAGFYGAIYQYLATGKGPDDPRDFFFPKTGRTRKDGTADRVSLPTYIRDVASLTNRADEGPVRIVSNAWTMAKHKVNPMIGTLAEMLENQDFYGKAIYNPADPSVNKARDLAAHVLKAFEPFAVRNYEQQGQQGAPVEQKAQSFFGVTPAPSYVTRTAEQQRAEEAKRKITLTPIGKLQQERKKAGAGRN